MTLKYNIKEDLRYKEGLEDGLEKGIEKERNKRIFRLLKLGKLSLEEIAESFEVELALVETMQKKVG